MPITYELDRQTNVLHLAGGFPISLDDIQNVMPKLVREIRGFEDLKLLVEISEFKQHDAHPALDIGMPFLNDTKGHIVRIAFVRPDDIADHVSELVEFARNQVCPARSFGSIVEAQSWLLSRSPT